MTLQRILLLGAWLTCAGSLAAQTIVATLELDRKEPKPILFEYCEADEGLVAVSNYNPNSSKVIGLFKYDAQFKRQWQVQLYEQNGRRVLDHMTVLGDKVLVFVSEHIPRTDEMKMFLFQYTLDGRALNEATEVYTSKNENKPRRIMRFERTADKKQLLAIGVVDDETEKITELEKFDYVVFSADQDEYKRETAQMPPDPGQFEMEDVKMNAKGSIFVLGKLFVEKRARRNSSDPPYKFTLYRLEKGGAAFQEVPFDFQGKVVNDLAMRTDREGNLIIAGFYSNRDASLVGGVLYFRYQVDSSRFIVSTYDRIGPDIAARIVKAKRLPRNKGELPDLYLDRIILRSDGGVVILAEQFYITTTSYRDNFGNFNSHTLYNYDNIVVLSISALGNIEWATVVNKEQEGLSQDELSYAPMVGPDRLLLFFKLITRGSGTNVYVCSINDAGELGSVRPFFQRFVNADVFYRKAAEQINNEEGILVYTSGGGRTFHLARVALGQAE